MSFTWVIDKLWYSHNREYYLAKKNELLIYIDNMEKSQNNYTEWKKRDKRILVLFHSYTILRNAN